MSYDFDIPFQRRMVAGAWQDGKLLRDKEVYNPQFITDEVLAGVLKTLQDLQASSGSVPDLPAVMESVKTQVAPGRKWAEYAEEAKKVWSKTKGDLTHYNRTAVDFARQRAVTEAIETAHSLVKDGELERIESLIRKALRTGGSGGEAVDFLSTSAQRFLCYAEADKSALGTRVPSGISPLDAAMRGGIGVGEMGVVEGLLGTGKSHFLVEVGTNAFLAGHSVLHVSLENSREITETRYDCRILGFPVEKLQFKPKTYRKRMKELTDALKSRLLVSYFPTRTLTLAKLEAHIESVDPRPSLVLVDYAALLCPPARVDERRLQLVGIYEGLRGLTSRTGTRLWTAHQANRSGMDFGLLDERHLSECFEIGGIVDYGVSINIRDDKPALLDLNVWKNRNGVGNFVIPCERDYSISKIRPLLEA